MSDNDLNPNTEPFFDDIGDALTKLHTDMACQDEGDRRAMVDAKALAVVMKAATELAHWRRQAADLLAANNQYLARARMSDAQAGRLYQQNLKYEAQHRAWRDGVYMATPSPLMMPVRQTELGDLPTAVPTVRKITDLLDLVDRLRCAVTKARDQFDAYHAAHLRKEPPDIAKANTNFEFRKMMDAALNAKTSPVSDTTKSENQKLPAIGKWLAAALDDPTTCAEMKADIESWFASGLTYPIGDPAAWLMTFADGRTLAVTDHLDVAGKGWREVEPLYRDARLHPELRLDVARKAEPYATPDKPAVQLLRELGFTVIPPDTVPATSGYMQVPPNPPKEWTTESLAEWAEATFGPAPSDARIVARANEEMAEGIEECAGCLGIEDGESLPKQATEAADVSIVLCRLGKKYNTDIKAIALAEPQDSDMLADPLLILWSSANSALSRLMRAVTANKPPQEIAAGLAATTRALARVAITCGTTLWAAVDAKMAINDARQWKTDGTGHGYHVREKKS